MPEAPRITSLLGDLRTVALASTLVVAVASLARAQAPGTGAKAGAGVFPLSPVWTVTLDTSPALAP